MALAGIVSRPVNPSEKNYKWSGDKGKKDTERLSWYNKAEDKVEFFSLEKPFEFIVLAGSMSANGWDDRAKKGIWSTEVQWTSDWNSTIAKQVRLFKDKEELTIATLADIKNSRSDAKLANNLYIYNLTDKRIERFLGANSSTMTNSIRQMLFSKEEHSGITFGSMVYTIDGVIETDRGFFRPNFKAVRPLSQEEDDLQTQLSGVVSDYLNFDAPMVQPNVEPKEIVEEETSELTPEEIAEIPF